MSHHRANIISLQGAKDSNLDPASEKLGNGIGSGGDAGQPLNNSEYADAASRGRYPEQNQLQGEFVSPLATWNPLEACMCEYSKD